MNFCLLRDQATVFTAPSKRIRSVHLSMGCGKNRKKHREKWHTSLLQGLVPKAKPLLSQKAFIHTFPGLPEKKGGVVKKEKEREEWKSMKPGLKVIILQKLRIQSNTQRKKKKKKGSHLKAEAILNTNIGSGCCAGSSGAPGQLLSTRLPVPGEWLDHSESQSIRLNKQPQLS